MASLKRPCTLLTAARSWALRVPHPDLALPEGLKGCAHSLDSGKKYELRTSSLIWRRQRAALCVLQCRSLTSHDLLCKYAGEGCWVRVHESTVQRTGGADVMC